MMSKEHNGVSMGTAALITGFTLFVPTAPYAEFYVFGKLIDYADGAKTAQNLLEHPRLFLSGIFSMLLMFILDVVLAWTMYIFIRPVNPSLALLGAWFRIVYSGLALVALLNFLYAFHLMHIPAAWQSLRNSEILQLVNARRLGMHLAYIIFGIYLILSGFLIYKASYIPKIMGVLMALAGLAWIITNLQPYLFAAYDLSWVLFFGIGELIFSIWLLLKGKSIKEPEVDYLKPIRL